MCDTQFGRITFKILGLVCRDTQQFFLAKYPKPCRLYFNNLQPHQGEEGKEGYSIMTSIGALLLTVELSFFASPDKFAPINQLLNETYLESNNYN